MKRPCATPIPSRNPGPAKPFGLRRRKCDSGRSRQVVRPALEADPERALRPIVQAAEERQRKAGLELHEGLSQRLAGLALLAGALAVRLGRGESEEAVAALEIARELGVTVQVARDLAVGLYPVDAVHGEAHAVLDHVAARACRERGVHWEMHHEGAEPDLEESERIQLCRILEETIDQAVQERGAGRVRVELRVEDWGFVLRVTDDGTKAFRMGETSRLLLTCRARLFGAQMRVRKCLGGGQQVSFRWEAGAAAAQ